jgi:hypothetical protein
MFRDIVDVVAPDPTKKTLFYIYFSDFLSPWIQAYSQFLTFNSKFHEEL